MNPSEHTKSLFRWGVSGGGRSSPSPGNLGRAWHGGGGIFHIQLLALPSPSSKNGPPAALPTLPGGIDLERHAECHTPWIIIIECGVAKPRTKEISFQCLIACPCSERSSLALALAIAESKYQAVAKLNELDLVITWINYNLTAKGPFTTGFKKTTAGFQESNHWTGGLQVEGLQAGGLQAWAANLGSVRALIELGPTGREPTGCGPTGSGNRFGICQSTH